MQLGPAQTTEMQSNVQKPSLFKQYVQIQYIYSMMSSQCKIVHVESSTFVFNSVEITSESDLSML